MYTVIRLIDEKKIPLNTFHDCTEAKQWAQLQMKWLDREFDYYILAWHESEAMRIDIIDRRLKLVK